MINTYVDFCKFYKTYGRCINQISKPKHSLTEKELKNKYDSFQKKNNKIVNPDKQWKDIRDLVHKRDKEQCRFLSLLKIDNIEAYNYIVNNVSFSILSILDPAHVISRTESKNLYYNTDNIILLNRYSHSMLDSYHDPIYGKSITKEEREYWFRYIIGDKQFEKLLFLK